MSGRHAFGKDADFLILTSSKLRYFETLPTDWLTSVAKKFQFNFGLGRMLFFYKCVQFQTLLSSGREVIMFDLNHISTRKLLDSSHILNNFRLTRCHPGCGGSLSICFRGFWWSRGRLKRSRGKSCLFHHHQNREKNRTWSQTPAQTVTHPPICQYLYVILSKWLPGLKSNEFDNFLS